MKRSESLLVLIFIFFWYSAVYPALIAGTLVKTSQGLVSVEQLHIGDQVTTCFPNKLISTAQISKFSQYTTDTVIMIVTNKGSLAVSKDQLLYDPMLNQWIQVQDLTKNNVLLDYHGNQLKCIKVKLHRETAITHRLSLEYPHTFYISDLQILAHNFVPLIFGISFAFGLGEGIMLGSISASLGAWTLWRYFKDKEKYIWFNQDQHNQNGAKQNNTSNYQAGNSPEDPNDDFFKKMKSEFKRKYRSHRHGNFYKDAKTELLWSKDRANHGNSQFKVFKETSKGLEWLYDADHLGNPIKGKHKGPVGAFIPYKDLIVCP